MDTDSDLDLDMVINLNIDLDLDTNTDTDLGTDMDNIRGHRHMFVKRLEDQTFYMTVLPFI
jgi:hypothetical protein